MDRLLTLLASEYGIVSESIFSASGGFSTKAAYRVVGVDGVEYFLKVYDKHRPTTRFFVERIDMYMPVLDWVSMTPDLHGRILTPIQARNGEYKAETDDDVYVLFLYVHGNVPGVQGMTRKQTVELADTLALLHNIGNAVPFETHGLTEDISLPFCEQLLNFLDKANIEDKELAQLISPHAALLRRAVLNVQHLRDTVRLNYSPLVLCHGDAHGNNVIQGERLVLADWEDLRWAPAEADLFICAWHPHSDTLLEAYTAARCGYSINYDMLYFYTLRRRIEDVWVDIQLLTEESPVEAEKAKCFDYIHRGIQEVQIFMENNNYEH